MNEPTLNEPTLNERAPTPRREATEVGLGCLFIIASTLLTCVLLFINGGLVQAAYAMLAPTGPIWMHKPSVSQFVMFLGPVLLVVIEWVMIDFLIGRLRRSS